MVLRSFEPMVGVVTGVARCANYRPALQVKRHVRFELNIPRQINSWRHINNALPVDAAPIAAGVIDCVLNRSCGFSRPGVVGVIGRGENIKDARS